MSDFFNKDILVTGGCGSIGSEIVKQLIQHKPKRIRVFDHDEKGHFLLNQVITHENIRNLIGDIRDKDRVKRAMDGVDIVFHAAALKHVPFCEYNPYEAVYSNIIGTKNVVEAAIEKKVKKCIGVSTDKAVNPVNTMGATKLLSERLIINAPVGTSNLKLSVVRFGNVLASSGSVIPIFMKQIKDGGPLTLTSEKMTRFFMTIQDAVSLLLYSTKMMQGREIFILKMPSVNIRDLAEVMIGKYAPYYDHSKEAIEIIINGIRPGEKLHEELFTREEMPYIEERDNLYILRNSPFDIYKPDYSKELSGYHSSLTNKLHKEAISDILDELSLI